MIYEKFSPPLLSEFPDEWYDMNEADHFWFAWRARVLSRLLAENQVPADRALRAIEIGCGVGLLRTQIEALTRWTVDGADVNESALQKVRDCRGRTLLYNIEDRMPTMKDGYDAAILFDVLEHIEEPQKFLTAALWHLRPGGWVLINVPALAALHSRYDDLVGHFRRYDKNAMRHLLESCQLRVADSRYWGLSLIPVAWLRKIVLRRCSSPEKAVAVGFKTPASWINHLFKMAMGLETRLWPHPLIGTSLMVLARKEPVS